MICPKCGEIIPPPPEPNRSKNANLNGGRDPDVVRADVLDESRILVALSLAKDSTLSQAELLIDAVTEMIPLRRIDRLLWHLGQDTLVGMKDSTTGQRYYLKKGRRPGGDDG